MLTTEDPSHMRSQIEFLIRIIEPSPAWLDKLGNHVEFLCDAKVTEPVAYGRFGELFSAFEKFFELE